MKNSTCLALCILRTRYIV